MYCGRLIATHPDLFDGILKIRVGYVIGAELNCLKSLHVHLTYCRWVLHAIRLFLSIKADLDDDIKPEPLENRSPSEIRRLLLRVLMLKNGAPEDRHFHSQ